MQRREMAQAIANALFKAEDQADQGLMAASALISLMAETRLDHRLSAVLAADAVSEITEAIRAFGEARARLVAAHNALEQAAPALIGRETRLMGPLTGKPAADRPAATGHLSAVA